MQIVYCADTWKDSKTLLKMLRVYFQKNIVYKVGTFF